MRTRFVVGDSRGSCFGDGLHIFVLCREVRMHRRAFAGAQARYAGAPTRPGHSAGEHGAQQDRAGQHPPLPKPRFQSTRSLYDESRKDGTGWNTSTIQTETGRASVGTQGRGCAAHQPGAGVPRRDAALVAESVSPALHDHSRNSLQQNRQVERQRPTLQVYEVEVHEVVEVEFRAA